MKEVLITKLLQMNDINIIDDGGFYSRENSVFFLINSFGFYSRVASIQENTVLQSVVRSLTFKVVTLQFIVILANSFVYIIVFGQCNIIEQTIMRPLLRGEEIFVFG